MDFSTAWVFFAALTFAIVALVLVFASSSQKGGRSRERAEREAGHALPSANRDRPQNETRSEVNVPGRDGPG